jgi:hypothetical protein
MRGHDKEGGGGGGKYKRDGQCGKKGKGGVIDR